MNGRQNDGGSDFHFDELVWRDDSGQIDAGKTALTAIPDDREFERQLFLIRLARELSGLGKGSVLYGKPKAIRDFLERLFCLVVSLLLRGVGFVLGLLQKAINRGKLFRARRAKQRKSPGGTV